MTWTFRYSGNHQDEKRSAQKSCGTSPIAGCHLSSLKKIPTKRVGSRKNGCTLPKTNSSPLKTMVSNRNLLFQGSIFRGYVGFREATLKIFHVVQLVGGFNPSWKILVKLKIFPKFRGENKTYLKPPPSLTWNLKINPWKKMMVC